MATNNIKPFATSTSANILNDSDLASRSELETGFPLKSKADSKLIGKLMQNATAGAYDVGEFSAKYGTTDITGSDATGFATAFESALESYVNEKAPTPDLSSYATLASPALTGTATLNGQNIATVNQIPDVSHFVTDTTLANYPTSETVEAEFASYDKNIKTHIESELGGYVTEASYASDKETFLTKIEASSTYATQSAVSSSVSNLTTAIESKADASTLVNYATLAGAAFTGAVTVQEPTSASNPATKQYVDSAVSSVLKYKGTVANEAALPDSNNVTGDVWTTQDNNKEYAWDGTEWIELGPTIDLSEYLTTENASSIYLSKVDAQSTYQPIGDYATVTQLNAKADSSTLATYAPLASPSFTGTATLGGQTIATVDQIPDTDDFILKSITASNTGTTQVSTIQNNALTKTDLLFVSGILNRWQTNYTYSQILYSYDGRTYYSVNNSSTNPSAELGFTLGNGGNGLLLNASYDQSRGIVYSAKFIISPKTGSGSITVDMADVLTKDTADASYISLSGSRGTLAGYENTTVTDSALTINQNSPDSQQVTSAVAITVSNGTADTSWTKKVSIKNASATISLGSSWSWAGGSQPTLTAPSLLVLSWDNDVGFAILQTTGS